MAARAVSAARLGLTPLVVLAAILATLLGGFWALTVSPPLDLVVIPAGLAVTAIAGKRRYGVAMSLAAAATTLATSVFVFLLWAVFGPYVSICGKHIDAAWIWLPFTGGAIAFLAVGSWGLRSYRLWAIALAVVLSGAFILLLVAAVPGTAGFCET